jgi:hypothetical protein
VIDTDIGALLEKNKSSKRFEFVVKTIAPKYPNAILHIRPYKMLTILLYYE